MLNEIVFAGRKVLIPHIASYGIEAGTTLMIELNNGRVLSNDYDSSEDAEKIYKELETHINNFWNNARTQSEG